MDTTNDNDYFELEPFEQYKPQDSKFSASLKWLLCKSELDTSFLHEPFFEENELGKSLRNEIVQELINGNLYCMACRNLFQSNFETISDILEFLAMNSIEVNDENDDPVTWQVISQDSPFYVSAHLALIDSIMMFHSLRVMRFESVVNSLKKYSKIHPYGQLPSSLEQVCSFWLNQITKIVLDNVENECDLYAKQSSLARCQPHIYINEIGNDISLSLSNGTILAILIVFYTRDLEIDLSDICLQESVGFEESVENLNLIKEFCEKCINPRSFCFSFEDFLYSPFEMTINKLAFIADLFYLFELNPLPNLVHENHFEKFRDYLKKYFKKHFHATIPFLSARIGDVTRNSFIKKGSYAPGQSVNNQNNNDNSKKLSNTASITSSLLDNVSLEASQDFDLAKTQSSVNLASSKFRLNVNGDYAEIEHDDDDDLINEEIPNEQNGMFSSRTYVKSSSSNHNRMNLNENQTKIQADLSSNLNMVELQTSSNSAMKTCRVVNSTSQNLPNISDVKTEQNENTTGLVRRLSVTARPGDIFYKVKDVTESCSTTDNVETSEIEHTDNIEQEIIIKPQKQEAINTNTWRKTTTWNVKRNQSNPLQNETVDSGRLTPKNDLITNEKNSLSNIEPGSPMFSKELLSIRMQLKEKKTSMERDKRKLETELEKQRQTIGKQVFLQVVQKKSHEQLIEPIKQIESSNNSSCESPTPSQLTNSPSSSNLNTSSNREATRRQWDKTPKTFISDLDQTKDFLSNNINTGTSSVSSLSTPTSSASQSPPLNEKQHKAPIDNMSVDLSKAYYSRDEVIKAIESLKDKYIYSSSMNKHGQNGNGINSNNMVKDIEILNNKLTELQAEINRLTLQQQNQTNKKISQIKNNIAQQEVELVEHQTNSKNEEEKNENQNEGSFFISFGNGQAKREKPTLTPKKNLIFIKTNEEKQENKTPSITKTSNLLMTAVKQGTNITNTPNTNNNNSNNNQIDNSDNQLVNDGHEGDIDGSDGDSNDLKQRKKELIIQKQLERRQQQELRRMQLEEERAIKADELRQKEEEMAMKKLIEKNRKETIFQAYIDKKKQSEIESMTGCFGPPNSLLNAKKFHSTNRLRPASKSNTQNILENNDQSSLYSDRSNVQPYSTNTMVKTYSTNNLYQANKNTSNAPKKLSRVSRPPSCARPTISSLRKMNRTFSLNNVNEVGQAVTQQQEPQILPLTQASLAMANAASASSFNGNNEAVMRMNLLNESSKLGSKYASSNYLNDFTRNQFQPQQTRTTPRRRTPRNAEEFLLSQGITDPEGYLSKGFYVGSMLDLSKFSKPVENSQNLQNNMSKQEIDLQNPSSSSSSSMNNFQKNQKSFFLDHNGIKRRNSVHETTSMSMANLNYIGTGEHMFDNSTMKSNSNKSQNYYRALSNYNKMRSMTTNIIHDNNTNYEDHSDQINDGSTNGSSATGSDSSSSPTPSMQQKINFHHSNGTTLGPLMSAVSKMDNLSVISPSSSKTMNNYLDQRFNNEDDYDDYEYLERNLGAEPLNSSFNQQRKKQDTTTTTNVTDYYTDESNSCHNDDVLSNQFMQQFTNQENFLNNKKNMSLAPNNNNNNITNNLNINNKNINKLGNGNKNNMQMNINNNHHHQVNNNNNNWDHTSLASTNSIYSGDDLSYSNTLFEGSSWTASRKLLTKLSSNLDTLSTWSPNNKIASRLMNTSFIISTSITSSSLSQNSPVSQLNEENSLPSSLISPDPKPLRKTWSLSKETSQESTSSKMTPVHCSMFANLSKTANRTPRSTSVPFRTSNNLTGVNQQAYIDKQSPSTNTYIRKRNNLPSSATFCSTKTPDSGTMRKRVNNVSSPLNGHPNQFINQSPSMNLNNINEADYSGPKLYKRLTGKTNKSTIINSLNQLVLAGTVNAQLRKQVIEEIESSDARHFVILFRDYHLQYRGVYSYTSETDYIEKIVGQGPQRISEDMIEKYYKYNSGGKQFSPVQTKHLSIQCDALTIHSAYWQTRKASNPVTNVNQMTSNLGVLNHTQYSNFNQSPLANNGNTMRR
ncbi:unnamed protein product [Brachionus calyciflorus]|uniref:Uncharacterized protein n=1 Tax=Brachionus calyciflorus TaxID=104777 RepID=A0A813LVS8_9BILA|nr:unnamed protein product [Brachionus calyciflorus]